MRTGSMPEVIDLIGRGERIRTSYHLHPIQVIRFPAGTNRSCKV